MSQLSRGIPSSGPGSGTVTSISAGTGITLTPNPITTVGTVALTVPVTIALGGTNAISFSTIDGTVYYDGTSLVTTTTGTSGQVLTSNGVGVAPTYQSISGSFANSFPTDSGTATPVLGVLNVLGGLNTDTSGSGNTVTIAASPDQYLTNYRVANATPFAVNATDFYITVDTSTIAITIQLPDAPTIYRRFVIKDSAGNAVNRNVTVTTVSGIKFIDGATTFVMNSNYQASEFVYDNFGYQAF